MAFGLLVSIVFLSSVKVEGRLDRVSTYVIACARLNNVIIMEDIPFGMPCTSLEEEMEQQEITTHQMLHLG